MAKTIGVDPGDALVKVVELDGSYRKPRLLSVHTEPLAAGQPKAVSVAAAVRNAVDDGMKGERLKSIFDNLEASSAEIAAAAKRMNALLEETGPKVSAAVDSFEKAGAEATALINESRPQVRDILARVKDAADSAAKLLEGSRVATAKLLQLTVPGLVGSGRLLLALRGQPPLEIG